MASLKNKKIERKGISIWPLVGAIYCPIIFAVLVINLPKVQWKYVFESNKTRVARHHKKSQDIGLPGIPYWRNSGSAAILYLNRDGVAYAMCGPDFFCSEDLNSKKRRFYLSNLDLLSTNLIKVCYGLILTEKP